MSRVSSGWLVVASLLLLAAAAEPLRAQRQRPAARRSAPSALQAEFATVLLQAGRYDEAAREFRALLVRAPRNTVYRMNLARALAWGEHHREAEPLLSQLHHEMPRDSEIISLLRSARANLTPTATQAVGWLGEEPDYAPYRVALARALARERRPRLAIEQYDRLLAQGASPDTTVPSPTLLRRELIDAYTAANDRRGAMRVIRGSLTGAAQDTLLRRALAELLVADRQRDAALALYDSMLATTPTARLFADRARLRLARREREAAREDLASSIAIAPTADAYVMLGDLDRERGDYKAARAAYEAARVLDRDGTPMVAAALAGLAREERPAVALVPVVGDDTGWTTSIEGASDNLGVRFGSVSLRRAAGVGAAVIAVGAEYVMLREHSAVRSVDLGGVGASLGASRQFSSGPVLARIAGDVGVLHHADVRTIPEASASAALWQGAWEGSVSVAKSAAYRSLFTASSLLPDEGLPLIETSVAGALAGPVGSADVAISVQRSRFSDGNARITLQAYTRYQMAPNVYAVYSGTSQQFAQRSQRYWDPLMYSAHAAGVEYALRQLHGLSYAVRLLPGFSATREPDPRVASPFDDPSLNEIVRRNAVTFGASGDVSYRSRAWEVAGALSFGRGRAGEYQRVGALLTVRRGIGVEP